MENLENNLNELVSELLTNYKKFVDKKNNSAGTRARKNAQSLKKLLQSVRKYVLDLQKERKVEKAGSASVTASATASATASELIESVSESVTETEVSPPVVEAKSTKKTKAKKTKAKKTKAKKAKKAKTKSA